MRYGVCAAFVTALVLLLAPGASPTFPGGNGKLLVVAYSGQTREHEVFLLAPDGTGRVSLTDDFRGEVGDAAWSADGRRIAFLRYAFARDDGESPSRWSLWVMNADGTEKRLLRRFVGFYPSLAWSPDGTAIAIPLTDRDGLDLFAVAVNGSGERRLTSFGRAIVHFPVWSPDGTSVAFGAVTAPWRNTYAHLIRPDGTGLRRLTETPGAVADWSPDGSRLLFAGERLDGVHTIRPDGSGLERLPWRGDPDLFPGAWSPDGTKFLVFAEERWRNASVGFVNLDGTCLTTVRGTGNGTDADWQPVPGGGPSPAVRCADLNIQGGFTSGAHFARGETIELAVTVRNWGNEPGVATTLRVRGSHFTFVRGGLDRGSCTPGRVTTCALGTLAPGEVVRGRLVLRVARGGWSFATVDVASATYDSNPDGNVTRAGILTCSHGGTNGPDRIVGTPGPDVICARAGDDVVFGRGGRDIIRGEAGRDVLHGGPGTDYVDGGGGRDVLLGEGGNDFLDSLDDVADVLDGGPGRDTAYFDSRDRVARVERSEGPPEVAGRLAFLAGRLG